MIEEFLSYLRFELNRSMRTVDSYQRDLKLFEDFFTSLDDQLTWETVDTDVIRDWLEHMMDKGNKASSVKQRLAAVHTFYRYALAHHRVERDPSHGIEAPKQDKPLPQFLKENEMDRLLDHTAWGTTYKEVRARTIIMTFYETGIRASELTGLDDSDVDFSAHQLKVTGKGNKQRIIPFGSELETTLQQFIALRDEEVTPLCPALFLTEKGQRMRYNQVRLEVKNHLAQVCTLKKLSPHVLRHTFATAMLNHGANIESIKRLLGHASVSTTEIYTHTTFEQLQRVYNQAHPRA